MSEADALVVFTPSGKRGRFARGTPLLQAARTLIERTDMPLAMIASECGFSHQSHMGTAFRNLLGLTPLRYRSSFRDCGLALHQGLWQ